jgi:hypothetical protein
MRISSPAAASDFIHNAGGLDVDAQRFASWTDAGGPGFSLVFRLRCSADAEPAIDEPAKAGSPIGVSLKFAARRHEAPLK